MYSKVVVLLVSGLLATTGWTAEKGRASKQEGIGVGSGAVIGAAAGGPIGFVIGAAFGGWLGDRFHHEKTERLASQERYHEAQAEVVSLESLLAGSKREVSRAVSELERERVAHRGELTQALAIEVFFRTEDSALDGATEQRLAQFAQLIMPMEGTLIHLEGHADGRGEAQYNALLSSARASSVRDALISGGLPADRIIVSAVGESHSTAAEQDVDGMALERRVQMRLIDIADAPRVARQ